MVTAVTTALKSKSGHLTLTTFRVMSCLPARMGSRALEGKMGRTVKTAPEVAVMYREAFLVLVRVDPATVAGEEMEALEAPAEKAGMEGMEVASICMRQ